MIFTLYLGGYLLPKTQHRISEIREYIIYTMITNTSYAKEALTLNKDLALSIIPHIKDQSNRDSLFKGLNDYITNTNLLNINDYPSYQDQLQRKQQAKQNGLTGDYSIDRMLKLYKILDKYNILDDLSESSNTNSN